MQPNIKIKTQRRFTSSLLWKNTKMLFSSLFSFPVYTTSEMKMVNFRHAVKYESK